MHLQQEQLHRLIQNQDRLVQTQQDTCRALSDLNSAIRDLRSAVESNRLTVPQAQPMSQSRRNVGGFQRRATDQGSCGNPFRVPTPLISQPRRKSSIISDLDDSNRSTDDSEEGDGELDFERKQVRLDGLEVYAVVSALTAGTLVDVFDSYHPGDIVDLFTGGRYLEVFLSTVFMVTGTFGIVCGLHCIFVFSLVTMYGRTALGMERDDALEIFFANTGLQRIHGFRTFVGSLYSLMIQMIIVITAKVSNNPWVLLTVLTVTVRLMYHVHIDTQTVMEKAMVIFTAPSPPPPRKKEISVVKSLKSKDDDTDDDGISSSESIEKKSITNLGSNLLKKRSCMNMPASALVTEDSEQPIIEIKQRTSLKSNDGRRSSQSSEKKRSNLLKQKSTMIMPATAFNGASRESSTASQRSRKSLRWSVDDGEDSQCENKRVDTRSASSLSSSVAGAFNKATQRKKRSSLSQPAAMQIIESIHDADHENAIGSVGTSNGEVHCPSLLQCK
jgi:hypothetical protein